MRDVKQGSAGSRVREVAAVFLKLGTIAFGGPAAHIAMMHDEVVTRRRWVTDQEFNDLLGATNLIPGPNSTEMAIHLGFRRAGWRGLIAGGTLFILPAFAIVLAFAWAYVRYGSRPGATWLLYGVKPVIIAIIAQALWSLSRTALRSPVAAAVAAGVVALYLAGVNELVLLFGGGALVLVLRNGKRLASGAAALVPMVAAPVIALPAGLAAADTASTKDASLVTLFLTFLKIGSVLYGSGYVLLAFLRNDFVVRLGWLTDQQLLDAVSVGQFTPGPVFTTATFVGYVVAGFPGAVLATVAIFLPSFAFVALLNPIVPRLRGSALLSGMLDGVTAAALGLMAAVLWTLTRDAIVDWWTGAVAVIALAWLVKFRPPSAWVIVLGALSGVAHHYMVG
jgi:chromate transporter